MKLHLPTEEIKVAYENLLASATGIPSSIRSRKTIKKKLAWNQIYTFDNNEYQIYIPFELEENLFYKFGNKGYNPYLGAAHLIVFKENDRYNFEIKTELIFVESWDEHGNIFAYRLVISEDVFGNVKTAYYFQKDKVGLVSEIADSIEIHNCDLIKELSWYTNKKNSDTAVESDYQLLCIEKKCIKWLDPEVAADIERPIENIGSVWIRDEITNLDL